ncbi:hypothetical protein PGC34_07120 [Pseudomonas kribbensis]|uniref:hypothetical protein n=1 Tax=Pseudomonas kribbensis TaxID=1628086 RepID=UPI00273A2A0C|nr:hypothetical protein [Pseudomonas sp. A29(2023)]MDL5595673.1 hypothetical protein [Bacillus subtilis]
MNLPEKALYSIVLLVLSLGSTTIFADTFDGYECTDDCSGHQAGYDWAEQKGIDDENSCSTPSISFNEGCQSFVEGGAGVISTDDDGDEENDDDE